MALFRHIDLLLGDDASPYQKGHAEDRRKGEAGISDCLVLRSAVFQTNT
ncbi:hypothetical protein [Pseudooceanicola algae]|nr:hypothetical protein [Pseudooceanicola algae]